MLNLSSSYNYYSNEYYWKQTTKYDTHKNKELKEQYNKITKNKLLSPSFIIDLNQQKHDYIISLKNLARNIENDILELMDKDEDIYSNLMIKSDKENIITGHLLTNNINNLPEQLSFKINNIAQSQINTGQYLEKEKCDIASGKYEFFINNYNFKIDINDDDNNFDLQTKVCKSINNFDIGVRSFIEDNENLSRIIIESNKTGLDDEKNNLLFNITGDCILLDNLDITNVTQLPKNASFSINNLERESSSNFITINNVIEIDLKQNTNEIINLKIMPNFEKISDKIKIFINDFNNLIDITKKGLISDNNTKQLFDSLQFNIKNNLSELNIIGIDLDNEGYLYSDDSILNENIKNKNIKNIFNEETKFKNDILTLTQNITLDPMKFLDQVMITYPHPGYEFNNPYITSIYSGMLYDNFF